jgi:integrase
VGVPAAKRDTVHLTKRAVDKLQAASKDYIVWDAGVHGFGVRVYPTGAKVYLGKWGLGKRGKGQRRAIGHHGERWSPDPRTGEQRTLTVDLAREVAIEWRAQARRGLNPAADAIATAAIPTLRDFIDKEYQPFAETKKAAGTMLGYARQLERLKKWRGSSRLDMIEPADVERLHGDMKDTEVEANRTVSLLSTVIEMARAWRRIPRDHENPCAAVETYAEQPVERRLSDDEMGKIGDGIAVAEGEGKKRHLTDGRKEGAPHAGPAQLAAMRTIIFTGARPGEICGLELPELDLQRRLIVKRYWKTRGKTRVVVVRAIPLSDEAIVVLEEQLERRQIRKEWRESKYVFPGRHHGKSVTVSGLDGIWEQIRKTIGLEDVRLSDLGRHNFASEGADLGYSLHTIGRLLGHSQESTTTRYAHLGRGAAASAAQEISTRIAGKLKKKA